MGTCLSIRREGSDVSEGSGGGGRRRSSGRRRHRRRRHSSLDLSDSLTSSAVLTTKNRPLRHERVRWKSDVPLTEGQLKSRRDEFWDTAPAFEGKAEIWMALKAAAEAAETGEDYELAQAILDGAGVSLPHGSLVECYDELGTRYVIPVYCLSRPLNLSADDGDGSGGGGDGDAEDDRDSPAEHSEPVEKEGKELKVRLRVSLTSGDIRMVVNTAETVASAKRRLHESHGPKIPEPARQRWYYGGKLLRDRHRLGSASISAGHVIQCVVSKIDFDVIQAK